MRGKAVKKAIPVDWYLWDGTEETAARINEWATPAGRPGVGVWFAKINRIKGEYFYGDSAYTAEVYDFVHSRWIPLKTGAKVIKGIDGECYPCDEDIFRRTYDITEETVE